MPQQDGVLAGVGAAGVVRHRARADLRHGDHPRAAPRARAHLQAAAQGAVQLRGPAQTGESASYFFISSLLSFVRCKSRISTFRETRRPR